MLGWEFPPYISGGLGTACYGLTKGLNQHDTDVLFVLPKHVDAQYTEHLKLITPDSDPASTPSLQNTPNPIIPSQSPDPTPTQDQPEGPNDLGISGFERITFRMVPSNMKHPYATDEKAWEKNVEHVGQDNLGQVSPNPQNKNLSPDDPTNYSEHTDTVPPSQKQHDYDGDMLNEVQQYARTVVKLTRNENFDVIHAHDWMTYPAGLALAGLTGKPLVVHVHSTEYDRSGDNVNSRIYDIERRGMHGAMKVICVSMLTRSQVVHRYGVVPEKCEVVYNGIEMNGTPTNDNAEIKKGDKIVLFLGRITMQKGPEYFVSAAKRVLEKMPDAKFVMAGSGDMAREIIDLAASMGIGHKILFTGFLRGDNVERIFKMAHVYVMPSVSEPFGIAPLEAIRHDVPVIISKNSGVSEVLQHALKVDFWDVEDMANKIIAVLRHQPLSLTLREQADFEVRKLTWSGAAEKCIQIYDKAINGMTHTP